MHEQSWHRDKVAWLESQFERVNSEWLQDLAAGRPYPEVSDAQGRLMQFEGLLGKIEKRITYKPVAYGYARLPWYSFRAGASSLRSRNSIPYQRPLGLR